MKAILVVDVPTDDIKDYLIKYELYHKYNNISILNYSELKPMPRKLQENYMLFGEEVVWQKAIGYNMCIDDILGEQ